MFSLPPPMNKTALKCQQGVVTVIHFAHAVDKTFGFAAANGGTSSTINAAGVGRKLTDRRIAFHQRHELKALNASSLAYQVVK